MAKPTIAATKSPTFGPEERRLQRRIVDQVAQCLSYERRCAVRRRALRQAAKWLNQGRSAQVVLALLQEQEPSAVVTIGEEAVRAVQSRKARPRPRRRHEDWLRRQLDGLGGEPPAS